MFLRAELHVHTVLSPCAGVEMIPPVIVERALARGIDWIAITDHNASANIAAVQQAAAGSGLYVSPGMELQTREEVHLLCLFDRLEQIEAWQTQVDAALPRRPNDPETLGEQYVVDATGDFLHVEEQMLLISTTLSLEEAVNGVQQLGGLAIPAHVDRQAFGLIPMLGFVPPDLPVAALEVSRRIPFEQARQRYPQLSGYTLLLGGDVHYGQDFLGANYFEVQAPSTAEIRLALRQAAGRSFQVQP